MILPNKYEDISKNMLSLGLNVLNLLEMPTNTYHLYKQLLKLRNDKYELKFERFLLVLDFLFALGLINISNGKVIKI